MVEIIYLYRNMSRQMTSRRWRRLNVAGDEKGRLAIARLIYSAIASLDGYIEDEDGKFDWAEPDEEVHAFFNDLSRPVGTYLLGRRMYEVMVYWETIDLSSDQPPFIQDFARIWRSADKIVFSKTLAEVSSAKTRIERDFEPETIRQQKAAADHDLSVAGPELAAHAFRAGLVDHLHLVVAPVVVGGGKQALPDRVRLELELLEERRFRGGFVHLSYRITA
jgi:dihydrofolate reductase